MDSNYFLKWKAFNSVDSLSLYQSTTCFHWNKALPATFYGERHAVKNIFYKLLQNCQNYTSDIVFRLSKIVIEILLKNAVLCMVR